MFYRMFGIDYYDAILTSGSFQESNIRTLEDMRGTKVKDVRVVGSTYMDSLKEKYDKYKDGNKEKITLIRQTSCAAGIFMGRKLDSQPI